LGPIGIGLFWERKAYFWAQVYFGREKTIFGCRPILVNKSLFLEHASYVEENKHAEDEGIVECGIWRKRSMPKTEETQCGVHADKPIHVRVWILDMNVMAMSQKNSINQGL
jgi:hypothetical protein